MALIDCETRWPHLLLVSTLEPPIPWSPSLSGVVPRFSPRDSRDRALLRRTYDLAGQIQIGAMVTAMKLHHMGALSRRTDVCGVWSYDARTGGFIPSILRTYETSHLTRLTVTDWPGPTAECTARGIPQTQYLVE